MYRKVSAILRIHNMPVSFFINFYDNGLTVEQAGIVLVIMRPAKANFSAVRKICSL